MAVEWLGKDFALDILAVFPLYGHFDCLFCSIIYRQIKRVSRHYIELLYSSINDAIEKEGLSYELLLYFW